MDYIPIGGRFDGAPTYMVNTTTYNLSDAQLNNDMDAKGIGAPMGTLIATPGYKKMKQRGNDGSWTEL